ncbi:isochorismatase family protein [uncultured Corynebacterium sp.]|uniref:isochorismatase family protein n=1 Tax=uncultured Corynebacterium sp. TaxID=159447 RepID=UPI00341DF91D
MTSHHPLLEKGIMSEPRRALILVDPQNEYFGGPLEIWYPPRDQTLATIVEAITIANDNNIAVAAIRHELPAGTPIFATGSAGAELHPEIATLAKPEGRQESKIYASVFDGTNLEAWLRAQDVDTITLVGFMRNNCVIGSAVGAEPPGLKVEVLSNATGAINISNAAGEVDGKTLHTTLMAMLNSNLAAVTDVADWGQAVADKAALQGSNLIESALNARAGA